VVVVAAAEDGDAMRRLASGDENALRELYGRYKGMVYGLALRITGDAHLAEEVQADAFLKIAREAASYVDSAAGVAPWLLRIARNAAIDVTRRRKRAPRPAGDALDLDSPPDPAPAPFERASLREFGAAVESALREIAAGPREALTLAYFSGLTPTEIAERRAVPSGTAKTWVRTGLSALRERLARFAQEVRK
jgi:RNA polymerase sigma-70 factor (ECF subfamily)